MLLRRDTMAAARWKAPNDWLKRRLEDTMRVLLAAGAGDNRAESDVFKDLPDWPREWWEQVGTAEEMAIWRK